MPGTRANAGPLLWLVMGLVLGCSPSYSLAEEPPGGKGPTLMAAQTGSVYDFTLNDINGKPRSLSAVSLPFFSRADG